MKAKINPSMFSKNSCPMTLKIVDSTELAIYVKRFDGKVVYTHGGKNFAINVKDLNVKT